MKKIIAFLKKLLKIFSVGFCILLVISKFSNCGIVPKEEEASALTLSACAEVSAAAEEETIYPTENLIPYPYVFNPSLGNESNGIVFSFNSNGSITLNGQNNGSNNSYIDIHYTNDYFILKRGDYIFSCGIDNDIKLGLYIKTNDSYLLCTNNIPFVLEDDTRCENILIIIQDTNKFIFENTTIYPMLNRGSVAYPFIPNLDGVYNSGYEEGFSNGNETGYNNGLSEGASAAQYGYFSGATINGTMLNASDGWAETNINFNISNIPYITGGIDFSKLDGTLSDLLPNNDYWWNRTEIYVTLKNSVLANDFKLLAYGNSTSFYSTPYIILDDGEKIAAEWQEQDGANGTNYSLKIPTDAMQKNVKKLLFDWGGGVDGLDVSVIQADLGYFAGQAAGYNAGLNEGKTYGYNDGYKDGESAGYNAGKEAAVVEGINGTGIFYGVIQILRMLFTLLVELLKTKIAGDLTVGLFVVGIPMTFVIIDMVFGLVRKFTGRTGSDE